LNIDALSGLQILEMMIRGELPPPPMAQTIPMRLESVAEGAVVFTASAGREHLNPLGLVHGGLAATVLDSATGCAIHTRLPAGAFYSTLDLSVKMLKPVPRDTHLICRATVVDIGKRVAVAEGRLTDEEGTLYAYATSTCMIRSPSGDRVETNGRAQGSSEK